MQGQDEEDIKGFKDFDGQDEEEDFEGQMQGQDDEDDEDLKVKMMKKFRILSVIC
jgi:hypothetical protein